MATLPGSGGSVLVFNVNSPAGSSTSNLVNDFLNAVGGNPPAISDLSNGGTESSVQGGLNIVAPQGSTVVSLQYGDQYTYFNTGFPSNLNGSSVGGDTVLAAGDAVYNETGTAGNNEVTFVDGTNVFQGSSISGGGDTVAGGSGYDTINIYGGSNTIFSGTGHTLINLYDTSPGDIVGMFAGNTTVNADGVSDTIAAGQSATGTIFGGAGHLTFVASPDSSNLAVTILGGAGQVTMFGATGTDLTFGQGAATDPQGIFVAGDGNETLNGANALGGIAFFGDTSATSAVDSITGGSGGNYFSTGAGQESIDAGLGASQFEINTVGGGGATITISDFSAADSVNFAGLSVSAETSLLGSSSTVSGGNLTVTLQDGTKVEFLGVTSLTGHLN